MDPCVISPIAPALAALFSFCWFSSLLRLRSTLGCLGGMCGGACCACVWLRCCLSRKKGPFLLLAREDLQVRCDYSAFHLEPEQWETAGGGNLQEPALGSRCALCALEPLFSLLAFDKWGARRLCLGLLHVELDSTDFSHGANQHTRTAHAHARAHFAARLSAAHFACLVSQRTLRLRICFNLVSACTGPHVAPSWASAVSLRRRDLFCTFDRILSLIVTPRSVL